MIEKPSRWIKIGEAAKLMGVSVSSLRKQANLGTIPVAFVSVGGTRYFAYEALLALREKNVDHLLSAFRSFCGRNGWSFTLVHRAASRPGVEIVMMQGEDS